MLGVIPASFNFDFSKTARGEADALACPQPPAGAHGCDNRGGGGGGGKGRRYRSLLSVRRVFVRRLMSFAYLFSCVYTNIH
jgi:hypothetical protein